jgi:hypothetical protein
MREGVPLGEGEVEASHLLGVGLEVCHYLKIIQMWIL